VSKHEKEVEIGRHDVDCDIDVILCRLAGNWTDLHSREQFGFH